MTDEPGPPAATHRTSVLSWLLGGAALYLLPITAIFLDEIVLGTHAIHPLLVRLGIAGFVETLYWPVIMVVRFLLNID